MQPIRRLAFVINEQKNRGARSCPNCSWQRAREAGVEIDHTGAFPLPDVSQGS